MAIIKEWQYLDRVWGTLVPEHRDSALGILLIGPAAEAEEKALELAGERPETPLVLRAKERTWTEQQNDLEPFLEPEIQRSLIDPPKEFPVVLLLGLDNFPETSFFTFKGRLETPKCPWLCIATAENVRAIPDWLSSMFMQVKGLKRRSSSGS